MKVYLRTAHGLTLIEILVVIAVVAIILVVMTEIFYRSLRASTKAQMLAAMKQNAQFTMDYLDKAIREADKIVCPAVTPGINVATYSSTLVVFKGGVYKRFAFFPSTPSATTDYNGYILEDNATSCDQIVNPQEALYLTDTDQKAGVSISDGLFTRNSSTGFKDIVSVFFNVSPAKESPKSISSQLSPIPYNTTIKLR